MAEKATAVESKPNTDGTAASPVVKRHPGHRHTDVRDTVAEMAARAQEISQEAGSKVAGAMKDVINAAAGLAGFAVESARDLVQYMVRRGQMTQEEADKLIREAETAANSKRKPAPTNERVVRHQPKKAPPRLAHAKKRASPRAAKSRSSAKASAGRKKPAAPARAKKRPAKKKRK